MLTFPNLFYFCFLPPLPHSKLFSPPFLSPDCVWSIYFYFFRHLVYLTESSTTCTSKTMYFWVKNCAFVNPPVKDSIDSGHSGYSSESGVSQESYNEEVDPKSKFCKFLSFPFFSFTNTFLQILLSYCFFFYP